MLSVASQNGTSGCSVQEQMLLIRLLEDRLQELCLAGECQADLHFSKGQEAISQGVIACLQDSDYVVVHHRTVAHAVAKGVPLVPLVAELLGKAHGINGGMAGEMHLSYPEKRFMFSFQLVGTCVPVAAGLAWAVKHHLKTDDIVAVFHGDAATSNGQWHEGLNLAAVQKLPLLLVCENNHLAGNVRSMDYLPVEHITDRAKAYGINAHLVDGNNLDEVRQAAQSLINYVRAYSRPALLECETTRLGRHKQGQGDIRSKEELAALATRDPLLNIALAPDRQAMIERMVETVIAEALRGDAPLPPQED